MESDIYEKTESGYSLRQRNAEMMVAVVIVCFVGFGWLLSFGWGKDDLRTSSFWIIAGIFLVYVVASIAVLCNECRRIVINQEGVWLHRPLAKTKFIAWKDVQDWGIVHKWRWRGFDYALYFSTVSLKPTRREKNKTLPLTCKKTVYIRVKIEDISSLERTKVLSFCRYHMGWNNTAVKKYVPMFTSEHVHF